MLSIGLNSKYSPYLQILRAEPQRMNCGGHNPVHNTCTNLRVSTSLNVAPRLGLLPHLVPALLIHSAGKEKRNQSVLSTYTDIQKDHLWGTVISRYLSYHGCKNSSKEAEPTAQGTPLCQGPCSHRTLQAHLHHRLIRHVPCPFLSSFLFKGH